MTRRLLGPVGGPILFFCVAALVFAGLGWVTVAALRVEQSQRESAARAELEATLRVALWKLDCRMLPTLGVEDSRPYYHFSSGDVSTTYGPAAAPLLAADLPEWMQLHFQLDPDAGWCSPQVMPAETVVRIQEQWPGLSCRNVTAERATRLKDLSALCPAEQVVSTLAARDRATPADSPLATGLFNHVQEVEPVQQQPDSGPMPPPPAVPILPPPSAPPAPLTDTDAAETFRLFNWELRLDGEAIARTVALARAASEKDVRGTTTGQAPQVRAPGAPAGRAMGGEATNTLSVAVPAPRPIPQAANPPNGRGGARVGNDNERTQNYDSTVRAKTIADAAIEAGRAARVDYPMFNKGQAAVNPPGNFAPGNIAQGNTAQNTQPVLPSFPAPSGPIAGAFGGAGFGGGGGGFNGGGVGSGGLGAPTGAPGMLLPKAMPAASPQPYSEPFTLGTPSSVPPSRGASGPAAPAGGGAGFVPLMPLPAPTAPAPPGTAGGFGGARPGGVPEKSDKMAKDMPRVGIPGEPSSAGGAAPSGGKLPDMDGGFFRNVELSAQKKFSTATFDEAGKDNRTTGDAAGDGNRKDDAGKSKQAEGRDEKKFMDADGKEGLFEMLKYRRQSLDNMREREAGEKGPAAEKREEAKPDADRRANEPVLPTPAVVPMPPVAVHLGSMRPQWLPAASGPDELVLVRTAKVDGKTVYQGVVLDWTKLEAVLKDEVKDQLPGAKLVPVRDPAGVSPERAMASLPVQLDPGPPADLPPAGWTPLRIGLVLAWVAAVIAFAAVGLSGWSLIDSSERRIRFVSAVTHELRTPLTSLRLYIDLLLSGMVQDEQKRQEYLSTLNVESDRLHRLIDNVLDFARLEGRRRKAAERPTCVGELLDQIRQTWADRCGNDGKELIVISTLSPEQAVCTDVHLVQQIVGNLIDNARKYTRDAADQRIWLWAKPDGAKRIVFEVEDRGPGVLPRERRTIFRPFRRGDEADARAGGAGLGLALAKQWAEALGGRLAYRPADGGTGACFRLELRVK